MFKFDNTHIFTGYLKQKLSSINIPTCKIYTRDFANYRAEHGVEDPRVIESINTVDYRTDKTDENIRIATRVNYLKNNEPYFYFWKYEDYDKSSDLGHSKTSWKPSGNLFYNSEKRTPGLTKTLHSPGRFYDTTTHEYLGEYLRFLRDYHNINLMSLYNCFNNSICNNIFYKHEILLDNPNYDDSLEENEDNPAYLKSYRIFDSQDSNYRLYAIPVKLFADYTIAIDSYQGIELFCGLYSTHLDTSDRAIELIDRTYTKINKTMFNQPFLYDKLNVKYWTYDRELQKVSVTAQQGQQKEKVQLNNKTISRWDIASKEQDLKLFIKVPVSCKSSITILEGDFRGFNDSLYKPVKDESSSTIHKWSYKQNHTITNFNTTGNQDKLDLNKTSFKPISKIQLLAFNTGESYPFADRLVEYLSGSAITPIDEIPDNIKRVQRVMEQNRNYFKIEGLWEAKMQKLIYDYIMTSGPVEVDAEGRLIDRRRGYYSRLGHTNKSSLYDILGYVDRDAEKWYASWKQQNGKAVMLNSIQNVDIYDGLYDI